MVPFGPNTKLLKSPDIVKYDREKSSEIWILIFNYNLKKPFDHPANDTNI